MLFVCRVGSSSYHCLEWAADKTPDASNGRHFRRFLELLPVDRAQNEIRTSEDGKLKEHNSDVPCCLPQLGENWEVSGYSDL